ncbi:T9SS type A sorting domain-containing protein [Lacinutrix sp. Bg11-31]|uniref:T9SS type A sorting domain-containing protein n=1 Tax=Lacinutrix sp. Bg11-31 TaxID=2057808 RepID=UPI000C318D14|nr:T9SS type A sorting domain-containing protein [Lacinutrix sp. Bg11-31]AUC82359.1 hypothetical protein CW733_09520 [Lacinutrix sp. Bg11-31]
MLFKRNRLYLINLIYFLTTFTVTAQTTYTYTSAGLNGLWEDVTKWAPSYPGTTINSGDEVIIDGYANISGTLVITNNGTITSIGTIINDYGIVNYGNLKISGLIYNNLGFTTNYGTIEISSGGNLTNYGSVTNTSSGIIYNFGLIDHPFSTAGIIYNFGTLSGTGVHEENFSNDGVLSPGSILNPIGAYGVNTFISPFSTSDAYTHNSATLLIELESTTSYDKLTINSGTSGIASLSGTLTVNLLNGFTPTVGDTFTILTANTVTGTFDTTNLPSNYIWNITYNASSVVLEVTNTLSILDVEISQFKLYPNPTTNEFTIELGNSTILEKLTIYNNIGQLVGSSKESNIKTSSLAKGIYLVVITTNKGEASKKIIVE